HHLKSLSAGSERIEELRSGTGQKGLGAERADLIIKRLAPPGVEMRPDLVEKKDRRRAEILRERAGIGKDEREEQRLLFPGGGLRGGHSLGGVGCGEV